MRLVIPERTQLSAIESFNGGEVGERLAKTVWGLIDTHWTRLTHLSVFISSLSLNPDYERALMARLTRLRSLSIDAPNYFAMDFSAFTFLTHLKCSSSVDSIDEECAGDRVLPTLSGLTQLRSLELKAYQCMHLSRIASLPLISFKSGYLGCVDFEGEVEDERIPPMDWISKLTTLRALSLGSVPSYPSFFESLVALTQLTSLT